MKRDYRVELILINRVILLEELYPRKNPGADQDVVSRYRIARKMGSTFPPIVVSKKGAGYILIDGLHRMEAFREDDEMIRAQVYPEMAEKDILIKSIELNAVHGNQLVYKDLVHCGIKLEKMGLSIDEIADIVKVVPASLQRDINAKSGLKNAITGKTTYQPNVADAFKPCPTCKGEGRVPTVSSK